MIAPQDHLAILALYAEYNRAIDAGDVKGWLATFVEDGAFHHPTRTYSGASELWEFVSQRSEKLSAHPVDSQRHWNNQIAIEGNGAAVSASCGLLVAGLSRETGRPEIVAVGQYQDRLVRTGAGWRFEERRLTLS